MVEGRPEDQPRDEPRPDQALPEDATPLNESAPRDEPAAIPEEPAGDERLVTSPSQEAATASDAPPPGPTTSEVPAAANMPETPPEPAAASDAAATAAAAPTAPPAEHRRLMRSRDHHVLGGVAGGIAERMDTEAGLIRVLFIVLTLFTAGIGILAYIVLWISMPLEPQSEPTSQGVDAARAYQRPPHPASGRVGTLVVGLLLVLGGVAWLLETTDSIDVDWAVVLAIALIGLGALLVLTLGSMARGVLISLGVLLTVALAFVSLVDINFESSFGDRTEQPATVAELQDEYSHAFGSMTLDLRSLELPQGTTEVKASTSFGSLKVILPAKVPVRIDARTTFGTVDALDSEANGLRADRIVRDDTYDTAAQRIKLKVTATFGSVEVER
jgi:phage shock protein PspC (stress-responsive transcriptional regulator)